MVAVHPPLSEFLDQEQANRLAADGYFADAPAGLVAAWAQLTRTWDATVVRARSLPAHLLDQRVDGEWSFLETLRHLVFVTDAWLGDVVEDEGSAAYHPWGMPPHFATTAATQYGLRIDDRPTLDEVLAVRRERARRFADYVERLTEEDMARVCPAREGRFTVAGAVQTVAFEEWAHHQYATQDLAVLERW